ncbi:hypothetical protein R6Q57_023701 [Mikania cordata]
MPSQRVHWIVVEAYCNDIFVGSIACRLERKKGSGVRIYVMTFGVLAPYRGLGIGTTLLNHVAGLCSKQSIDEMHLHVQMNNEDATRFYKKYGIEITEIGQNLYTDCYVCTKYIGHTEFKK